MILAADFKTIVRLLYNAHPYVSNVAFVWLVWSDIRFWFIDDSTDQYGYFDWAGLPTDKYRQFNFAVCSEVPPNATPKTID